MKNMHIVAIYILFCTIVTSAQNSGKEIDDWNKNIFSYNLVWDQDWQENISTTSHRYDVLHYDINLTVFPDEKDIEGNTSITLVALAKIDTFLCFDFVGLELDSVLIDQERVDSYIEQETIFIQLPSPIVADDTSVVHIFYHGSPERGLYFRENKNGELVLYSFNEPYDAHYWFPCKDDPSDKAYLDIRVKAPQTYMVLSNGLLIDQGNFGQGMKYWSWQETYPIATYLISLVAGPYVIVDQEYRWQSQNMPLQYYVYQTDISRGDSALNMTQQIMSYYNEYIGEYPYFDEKYAMVEAPFREALAMENQTATTMAEHIMDDEGIIAHELAHHWWGNALTPESFDHIWLNEGFASYFDALFTEYKYGPDDFNSQMLFYRSRALQSESLNYPIYAPPSEFLFGRAVYYKGAWVLHMLREKVGEQVFKKICRTYYEQYKYENVSTNDFVSICKSESGQDLDKFLNQWLYYGGFPELVATWVQQGAFIDIALEQNQAEPIYDLDLDLKIKGVSKDTLITIKLDKKSSTISIKFAEPVIQITIDPANKLFIKPSSPIYLLPSQSKIVRVFPNPFNEDVTIGYQLNRAQNIEIRIYNILGERVGTLIDSKQSSGMHFIKWNGHGHPSGTYFCTLKTADGSDVKKLLLLK